jgi:hypothetical protein
VEIREGNMATNIPDIIHLMMKKKCMFENNEREK